MLLLTGGCADLVLFENNSHAYGTLPASNLYDQAAFRALSNFGASSIAIISDNDLPTHCNNNSIQYSSELFNLELFSYYELDPTSSTYVDDIRSILLSLKENGVDSILGCSYIDLCIHVSNHLLEYCLLIDLY